MSHVACNGTGMLYSLSLLLQLHNKSIEYIEIKNQDNQNSAHVSAISGWYYWAMEDANTYCRWDTDDCYLFRLYRTIEEFDTAMQEITLYCSFTGSGRQLIRKVWNR